MEKEIICPLKLFNEIVGGKWKQSIICILESGLPMRYNEIRRMLPDITNMMLAQSLKNLEEYGIVNRVQYNEMPVRVEYSLTEEGKSLLPILLQINQWGRSYIRQHESFELQCSNCELTSTGKSHF